MQSQFRRRLILPYILAALVAGLAVFPTSATLRASAASSGKVASGRIYYPPNDPPVASDFSVSVTVGSPVTGMLGDHVVDPEHETLTFFINNAAKGNVAVDEI